jgi:ribosomal protein S18 acetylase RimI-like enzyme
MVAVIEPVVLPMTLLDVKACWELDRRCFAESDVYDISTFRMLLSSPDSVSCKVVEAGAEMKGFLVGMVDRDFSDPRRRGRLTGSGHVIAVGVAPESRGRGYARRLMRYAEQGFQRRGVSIVHLEVHVTNAAACRLYRDLGYFITERMAGYYGEAGDGYKMAKSLTSAPGAIEEGG